MKVLILTTSFPLRGGDLSGIFILEQARHLVRLGVQVDVLAPHHLGALRRETIEGISVKRFRYVLPDRHQTLCYGSGIPDNLKKSKWARLQIPFLALAFTIHAIMHVRNCDVIHSHWSIAGLAGLIAGKLFRKPVVLTMHHGTTLALTGIEKLVLEHVDQVLCNSSFTKANVLKTARPKAIKVIPPGVDIETFKPRPELSMNSPILPEISTDCLIIFTMGRLIELKGHKHLIDAVSLLPEDFKVHLLIGGEGPLRDKLESQAQERGLSDRVTFLGHIPNHLTPSYYAMADVYVQPSIIDRDGKTEGLGVTLLEAFASGIPCIGSRAGGIIDIVIDGVNGYLVNPEDSGDLVEKISRLLRNKDLRTMMGKKGREFVEKNYSWQAKVKELKQLYEQVPF